MSALPFRRARALGLVLGLVVVSLFAGTALAAGLRPAGPAVDAATNRVAVHLDGIDLAAMPPVVPGARVLAKSALSAQSTAPGADTDVLYGIFGPFNSRYAYAGHDQHVEVALGLPDGASIQRLDVYAFRATSGPIRVELGAEDATTGDGSFWFGATLQGNGVLHGAITPSDADLSADVVVMQTGPAYGFVGLVAQYTMPTTVLVPIKPVRVLDTRFPAMGGKVSKGSPRTVSMKNGIDSVSGAVNAPNVIPEGAVAVSYNLTVASTSGSGWAALVPGVSSTAGTSSINWTAANAVVANGGIVKLGTYSAERRITIVVGGGGASSVVSTHVILDITGYYVSES